tara:strand:- start:596 stop:1231 length:636 start_codon:yes stop_codon:yes gene_type:complete
MTTFIKICGIKSLTEVKVAKENNALWYGLVFFEKSPRNIDFNMAEFIVKQAPKLIYPVAVTVNPDETLIKKIVDIGIENIQLHGNEEVEHCMLLKKKFNIKIFKGIGLETEGDICEAKKYSKIVDWIIFDKKDDFLFGGTGKNFDWNILSKIDININYIISGGLTHKNVLEALTLTGARGVDVSSGVEGKYGVKSEELISKFCNSVKLFKR